MSGVLQYREASWRVEDRPGGSGTPPAAAGQPEVPCRVALAEDGLFVLPRGRAELYLYYSDLDRVLNDEGGARIGLSVFDRREYSLGRLGGYRGQFLDELRSRRQNQLLRNLLLLDEGRTEDFALGYQHFGPAGLLSEDKDARMALFRDSGVVFPDAADPFGFSYSDIEYMGFWRESYTFTLDLGLGERLVLSRLGSRFGEFEAELTRLMDEAVARGCAMLAAALPRGTSEGTVLRLGRLMRRGRSTARRDIEAISPGLWSALTRAAFLGPSGSPDELRLAAFRHLEGLTSPELVFLGFREATGAQGEDDSDHPDFSAETPDPLVHAAPDAAPRPLFWFVVALPAQDALASEVTNQAGHATYFFRLGGGAALGPEDVARRVRRLGRALQALNFRRDVIRASEAELATERLARYRVALRKLDYLREVRASFLGRAVHSSEAGWLADVARVTGP